MSFRDPQSPDRHRAPIALPVLCVGGSPEQMGLAQGEAFAALIRRFVPMRFEAVQTYMAEAGRGDLTTLLEVGRRSFAVFERWDPPAFTEHCAIARAAGVDAAELFTAGNMTDMRDAVMLAGPPPAASLPPDAEGCSVVLLPPDRTRDGAMLLGQTWDLNPEDIDYVVAIGRNPTSGPATWSVTVAGCPSLVGMNDRGLCVGTTNIKTWGGKVGVGYMNVLHRALNQPDFDAAAGVIEGAPRAGAHTYWVGDGERLREWEATPDTVVARDGRDGPIARTNHCLHPPHAARQGEVPSASSQRRLGRISGWIAEGARDVAALRDLFADRSDGVDSINRYPEDDQGTATNSVVIAVPARLELHACRGPADRGLWLRLPFPPRDR